MYNFPFKFLPQIIPLMFHEVQDKNFANQIKQLIFNPLKSIFGKFKTCPKCVCNHVLSEWPNFMKAKYGGIKEDLLGQYPHKSFVD